MPTFILCLHLRTSFRTSCMHCSSVVSVYSEIGRRLCTILNQASCILSGNMTLSDNKSLEPITTLPGLAVAHSGYAESYQRMPE